MMCCQVLAHLHDITFIYTQILGIKMERQARRILLLMTAAAILPQLNTGTEIQINVFIIPGI